jgi:hypothetical protein
MRKLVDNTLMSLGGVMQAPGPESLHRRER